MTTPSSTRNVNVVKCSRCGRSNRVPAVATGAPRCGNCHAPLPWIADAGDDDFAAIAEAATLPVLVDLWAPWCGPCRTVSPLLERLALDLAGRFKLVKVNVDEAPRLSERFEVRAVPTLLVLKQGKVVAHQPGAPPAAALRRWVSEAIGDQPPGGQP
jgi:thioredoxin 2